jgi:hypothetical protein
MKISTGQMKTSMESITNSPDKKEERLSRIEDRGGELLYSDSNFKKSNHGHNIQDLWDTIKKPNLQI